MTYANVMVTILAFIVLGGMSYAATGGNFILGKSNTASSKSTLSAPIADKALTVTNNSSKAGASALGLNVASGHPPFKVNSPTKVANLNADQVDGLDGSSGFGLVYLGTDPQTDGGVVIRWNELGAAFGTTGSSDGNVRIFNLNQSQHLHVLFRSGELNLGPGAHFDVNLDAVTTFLVWSDDRLRSWDVVSALRPLGLRRPCDVKELRAERAERVPMRSAAGCGSRPRELITKIQQPPSERSRLDPFTGPRRV
jgi:hypothetical protein